jgi:hypothetical protein
MGGLEAHLFIAPVTVEASSKIGSLAWSDGNLARSQHHLGPEPTR